MPDPSPSNPAEVAEGRSGDPGHNPTAFTSETTRSVIATMVDQDVDAAEGLAKLDPDQVSPSDVVKRRLGISFWIAVGWLVLLTLSSLFADFLPLADPEAIPRPALPSDKNLPPFSLNSQDQVMLLGSDNLGRDLLSRAIYGARVSIAVGFAAILFGLLIGGTLGLIGGYFRGRADTLVQAVAGIIIAIPAFVLALAVAGVFLQTEPGTRAPSVPNTILIVALAIGIPSIGPLALLVRSSTLQFGQREFVLASRTLGASHRRVILREVLPNVILPVSSFAFLAVGLAIVAEGGLAFFGASVQPPTSTWGVMLQEARSSITPAGAWWVVMVPIFFLVSTILSLNVAGDRVRRYFDVRESML